MRAWRKMRVGGAVLLGLGLASIVFSGTSLIPAAFGDNADISRQVFKWLGITGLILAVAVEHASARLTVRDRLTAFIWAARMVRSTLRSIGRRADQYCNAIRQCRSRGGIKRCLKAFLDAAFPSMCQELFEPDLLATLFQPSASGPKRLSISYMWTSDRPFDPGFAIDLPPGRGALPVDGKGVAGYAFATGVTHYIETDRLCCYERITLGIPGGPLVRECIEQDIWKPTDAPITYEALLCIPLCERLAGRKDEPEWRALGVLCLEIPRKAEFTDDDVLSAWSAADALTRVLATSRQQALVLRRQRAAKGRRANPEPAGAG